MSTFNERVLELARRDAGVKDCSADRIGRLIYGLVLSHPTETMERFARRVGNVAILAVVLELEQRSIEEEDYAADRIGGLINNLISHQTESTEQFVRRVGHVAIIAVATHRHHKRLNMPLSQNDPNLDYDGSWGDASVGWPSISFLTEEDARQASIAAWRDAKVPYGSSVLVDKELRLETEELKDRVQAVLKDTPSDAAFQVIVRSIKDGLPLTTSEDDLRVAIARRAWEMALRWNKK